MSSKKIYIVRHGQTDYNLRGVVQGSGINAPINENGLLQARAFYEKNKNVDFDRIYYSGLIRTQQSIAEFLKRDVPRYSLPELNEISWGKYEGVPMDHDENQYYLNMLSRWSEGQLDYSIDGGESPNQVVQRLKQGMEFILNNGGKNILICMHGRAMRILMCYLLNYDLRLMDTFQHQNLCCYQLTQLESGEFRLDDFIPGPML